MRPRWTIYERPVGATIAVMMTLHVLHAGDGYSYLTRQVASDDRQLGRGESLTDYYTAHGTPPGEWFGAGIESLAAMDAREHGEGNGPIAHGAAVTEAQMRALFGEGLHPNADSLIAQNVADGSTAKQAQDAVRLGRRFSTYANANPLGKAQEAALNQWVTESGRWPSAQEKAAIHDDAARLMFTEQKGRAPVDSGELGRWAKSAKGEVRQPVAGYDMVFTPPKSVSTVWALADDETRRAIERIHKRNVHDVLGWLEREAVFTRRGTNGVEQVETTGLSATLYDHYDSRAGDPNLHTHAAVSNKVKTGIDGKWRTIDGATLHRHAVAASQRYNARIMDDLSRELGFTLRSRSTGRGSQDVIELGEVPQELCDLFSSRRRDIETAYDRLVADFRQANGGRTPGPKEQYALYQQANLDTRSGKQEPESLAELRTKWRAQAGRFLTSDKKVESLAKSWSASRTLDDDARGLRPLGTLDNEARAVLRQVEDHRATWSRPHVIRAAESHLSAVAFDRPQRRDAVVSAVVDRVLSESIALAQPSLGEVPAALKRSNGELVTTRHGEALHTSKTVLAAEKKLLEACTEPSANIAEDAQVRAAVAAVEADSGHRMNAGQLRLVEHFTTTGTQVAVGIGPAGTGKTTAMAAVAQTWQETGKDVIALGPSRRAANELADSIGTHGYTLAELTYRWRGDHAAAGIAAQTLPDGMSIEPGAMLLVDEGSLATTKDLATLTEIADQHGAVVRLLGDPAQLDAVETGGAFRLLAERTQAPTLDTVIRFGDDTDQAEASLAIRTGDTRGLDLHTERGWIHTGTQSEVRDRIVDAYMADRRRGASSIIMATTRDDVASLNADIQAIYRRDGLVDSTATAPLADELHAGRGDTIVTRQNAKNLRCEGGRGKHRRVANGDLWRVEEVGADGALSVRNIDTEGRVVLPAAYVTNNVELGYAATVHRAQGMTVDTAKVLAGPGMDRAGLYVGLTRGRGANEVYVPLDTHVGPDTEGVHLDEIPTQPADDQVAARAVLDRIIATDNQQLSATEQMRQALADAKNPAQLRAAYLAAHDRLTGARDAHVRAIVEAHIEGLPRAIAAQVTDDGKAVLVDRLGTVYDRGGNVADALARADNRIDATWDGGLTAAHEPARVLASAVTAPEQSDALPQLPPAELVDDRELLAFAQRIGAQYSDQQPAPTAQADQVAELIEQYRHNQSQLDDERGRAALVEALGDQAGSRIADEDHSHRIGRQVERAHRAGLDPVDTIRAAAEQIEADLADTDRTPDADPYGRVRPGRLSVTVGAQINEQARAARADWLATHHSELAEHLPVAADNLNDPRWDAIADRMMVRQQLTGEDVGQMASDLAGRAGGDAPVGRVEHVLAETAGANADQHLPDWITPPDHDAHRVNPERAAALDAQYRQIADTHADYQRTASQQLTGTNAPRWAKELGARPADPNQAAQWDKAAAEAQLYRNTHRITDTTSLTGPRPEQRQQQQAHDSVHQANTRQQQAQQQRVEQQRAQQAQQAQRIAEQQRRQQMQQQQQQRMGPRRGR